MNNNADAKELAKHLEIWDQTVGCSLCENAWWGDNETANPTLFHTKDCPLLGRRDVAAFMFNVAYIEEQLGYPIGDGT